MSFRMVDYVGYKVFVVNIRVTEFSLHWLLHHLSNLVNSCSSITIYRDIVVRKHIGK